MVVKGSETLRTFLGFCGFCGTLGGADGSVVRDGVRFARGWRGGPS